ncbi:MAG: type IV pilin [Thermoplasmata archaeon]
MYKKENGVSEVIGTLLMLTITVVLFSSVFYYVATIPTPQAQVYSTFSAKLVPNNNGTFNITISNNAGEALTLSSTELIISISNPSYQVVHMLTYPKIYSQIISQSSNNMKGYFAPGMNFIYYSWWDGINDYNIQMIIHVYLIDIQNNQVVWNSVLQGITKPVTIIGTSYNPDPFPAVTSFNGKIFAYVIYNTQGVAPSVQISIPQLSIKNQPMIYYNQLVFLYSQTFSNLKPGNYTVWINATLNNIQYSYKTLLPVVVTSQSFIKLRVTSISLENPEPVHGSYTTIFISINNPFPENVNFKLNITDIFPSYPNGWQYIYTTPTNYSDPTGPYYLTGMTSTTISVTWFNIGGNYVAAGIHQLSASIINVTPSVPTAGKSINVTVFPKIIFVGYDFPNGNLNQYYNYYYNLFTYVDIPITINQVTTSTNIYVDISGYDFVIWVMGSQNADPRLGTYNGQNNFNEMMNLLSQGGSLLYVGNSTTNFNGFSQYIGSILPETLGVNTTAYFHNLTKISSNSVNIYLSNNKTYLANVTPNSASMGYVTFSPLSTSNVYTLTFSNFSGSSNPTSIYGIYNGTTSTSVHGKLIMVGFQTPTMYLYQQFYVYFKMLLWLSNITSLNGVQDIALVDMKMSNYNPVFMQPVNITFYIQNYSPTVFDSTYLEFLLNGQPVMVFDNGQNISSNNIYVPPISPNGAIIKVTVKWYVDISPGNYKIFAYVNPYHSPPEINYNNNFLVSNYNININVRYSALFIFVCGSSDKSQYPTSINSTLQNFSIYYNFIKYNEQSSNPPPNLVNPHSPYYFLNYNLVIIDFNQTGTLSNSNSNSNYGNMLASAINKYVTQNPYIGRFPMNLFILGEGAGYAINSNNSILSDLELNTIYVASSKSTVNLYGLNYSSNPGVNEFALNSTRGYGIIYKFYNYQNFVTSKDPESIKLLVDSSGNSYGIFENISNLNVAVIPLSPENFQGIIQLHSYYYGPSSGYGTVSSKYIFMLNILNAFSYHLNYSIPEILGSDLSVNSKYVMINQYYIISGYIRNLGTLSFSGILNAYDGNELLTAQTVYVPGLATIPIRIIWDPQYPSPPNLPRHIRLTITNISSSQFIIRKMNYNPFRILEEGIINIPVYIFYDNFSSSSYFTSYDVIWGYSGVQYYGTNYLYSAPPYAVFGKVNQYGQNYLFFGTGPSSLSSSQQQWVWMKPSGTPSGGYVLGVYYNMNEFNSGASKYYYIQTKKLYLHGSNYALLEMDAYFNLTNGGEGVIVFASPNGSSHWYWLSPVTGYPANVNVSGILPTNKYEYPQNSQDLVPAFSTTSGTVQIHYMHYIFNLTEALAYWGISLSSTSSISLRFVLVVNGGYTLDQYGNDSFLMDNVKVIESGPVTGSGSYNGDVWSLQKQGIMYIMNNTLYSTEIDNMVSVPITLQNVIWAKMDFYTDYQIWARFANAQDPSDVPNGFNLYIGILGPNGEVSWTQMDTRWAGEAGLVITKNLYNQWAWASQIYSVYYSGVYAFHQPEVYNDINLTGYIGNSVYLKFSAHGDNSNYWPDSYSGEVDYVTINGQTYTVDPNINAKNQWVAFTDVQIIGYSTIGVIQVNTSWT